MSKNNSTYPTVATIIGCPDQLNTANGLVATPIGASGELQPPNGAFISDTSSIKDPIQRAVLDNICGTLPTKNSPALVDELLLVSDMNDYLINYANLQLGNVLQLPAAEYCHCLFLSDKAIQVDLINKEYIKCEVCKVDCNGNAAYKSHLSGAKHSKKLKEQEMTQYLKLPYIRHNEDSNTFSCTLCCATLNAISQIAAHIEGQKHKNKALSHEPIATSNSQINSGRDPSKPRVDATPNLLYCATCNIHVNSALQLEQHTTSRKHIHRVNGKSNFKNPSYKWRPRGGSVGNKSSNSSYVSTTSYPKISHNFVPGGQFRPY